MKTRAQFKHVVYLIALFLKKKVNFLAICKVWKFPKFQDFSVTQISRKTNFRQFRSCKTAIFAILGALNFVHLVRLSLQKVQTKFRASKYVKMADFAFLESQELISRKSLSDRKIMKFPYCVLKSNDIKKHECSEWASMMKTK